MIISLNFEADCKEPWPDYVKARKVHEEWQALLAVEPRRPGPQRTAELKRELSMRFALGYDTSTVNRYLKMVDWTDEFEEYHIQKGIDTYEVKHRADRYFQYFDELSKGTNPGGVAYTLNQDEALKHLAFDLLFQGKFKNWDLIRNLKYPDPDARDALFRARDQVTDLEEARDLVETVLTDAKNRNREIRVVGANARITNFVNWLENLPLNAFRKDISEESLEKLLKALRLVEAQASAVTRDRNAKA